MVDARPFEPHHQLLVLIDEQDRRIVDLKERKEELQREARRERVNLGQLMAAMSELEDARKAALLEQRRLEGDLAQVEARLKKASRMENVRDFGAAQEAVEGVQRHKATLEDDILTQMVEVDDLTPKITALKERLEAARPQYEAHREEMKQSFAELTGLEAEAGGERVALLKELEQLDRALSGRYGRLYAKLGDRATTWPVGDNCGMCRMHLLPQRVVEVTQRLAMHNCEHCGRYILVK